MSRRAIRERRKDREQFRNGFRGEFERLVDGRGEVVDIPVKGASEVEGRVARRQGSLRVVTVEGYKRWEKAEDQKVVQ